MYETKQASTRYGLFALAALLVISILALGSCNPADPGQGNPVTAESHVFVMGVTGPDSAHAVPCYWKDGVTSFPSTPAGRPATRSVW